MRFSSPADRPTAPRSTREDSNLALTIDPSPRSAHHARTKIAAFITKLRPNSEAVTEFMLAVGEALANAVEHSRANESINIDVTFNENVVKVVIEDSGRGFESQNTVVTTLPATDEERGRGLPIIFRCTDSFTIDSRPSIGTRVALLRDLR